MATRATHGRMPEGGRIVRWMRKGSPLWELTTRPPRALVLPIALYATIMYLMILGGGYATLGDARFAESAKVAVNIAPFLVTGMVLLAVAAFISTRLVVVMSGIMAVLGTLMALLPGDGSTTLLTMLTDERTASTVLFPDRDRISTGEDISRGVELVMFAGPPVVILGLGLAVIGLNHALWRDDHPDTMPSELVTAAWIGLGYGWFSVSVTGNPVYFLISLASLLMLRWWQRFSLWIAGFATFVSMAGLIAAMVQEQPERLVHRLPWAIAVLAMVPLAQRGVRGIAASPSPPPDSSDGMEPNPGDSPEAPTPPSGRISIPDAGPTQGQQDTPIPQERPGSNETADAAPDDAGAHPMAELSRQTPPVRNETPTPVEAPLRWFARPNRYRRAGDRSSGTGDDT